MAEIMIHLPRPHFVATTGTINFQNNSRTVLLNFENEEPIAPLQVLVSEAIMANLTGHFLRQRLFGLH